jgi:hypothetical protein
MTPEELRSKAKKVEVLQAELKILKYNGNYLVVTRSESYIKTDTTNRVHLTPQLEEMSQFIFETIRTKMILDIEKQIKELCE